ncbi:hypothetical protein D0Z07_0242 [Hyphodiscus hymeniophilus]|uniref:Uncharacterized protein n=1 Tax=Hyphodiscus hymeniophilus TaxID=353542 RepID=A0A9P6VS86_9HELO|nr:hypothetical protein D0Z07_0242 [Hyphodiscus hymeniophilus]
MGPSFPSVQSFYSREISTAAEKDEESQSTPRKPGDGFTEEELADAVDPLRRKWDPEREYDECSIDNLIPGPKAVTFVGRIANLSTIHGSTQKQPKAAGWHYLILKDDTAAISIKLYFSSGQYPLKLGQLLSIWTIFISDAAKANTTAIQGVLACANLFPGRVTSDHVMIHTNSATDSICRTPLTYQRGRPLQGLITLDSYLGSGGHDGVVGVKILVCVKSIGPKKRISKKTGGECDLAEVMLFDNTGDIRWTLWGETIESAKDWQPGKTILLISNPGYRVEAHSQKGSIGVQQATMVDVDPEFPDAEWLRKFAVGVTKKESLCVEFPGDVFNEDVIDGAEYGVNRIMFRLAEIDDWVRNNPSHSFTGHVNITIMEMSLVKLRTRGMLLCNECCGVPIYANELEIPCKNCSKSLKLYLNPKIIGMLIDETGCITPGKLLWSERAWEQLLGRTVKEVTEMTNEEIRWLEQRMMFMRMHLVFGWEESVGRLAILGMRA